MPYSESNRTSYEGLRPENRTSSVYNAIDPDYQSAEQNSAAPAAQGTNEYFVLEKENQDCVVTTPKDNRIGNNAKPALTNADYFVLEQDVGVYPRNNSTAGVDGNKDSGTSSESHNYFVLEQQKCASNGPVSEGKGVQHSDETHAYFVLEKAANASIENK